MSNNIPGSWSDPQPLLDPQKVKAHLQSIAPNGGRDLTDADWEQIAARLERLARLIWRISVRQVAKEHEAD